MRLRARFIIIFIFSIIFCLSSVKGVEFIKERYIYKFIANKLQNYAQKNWNADLYIGEIKGSIFTNLTLKNLSLVDLKGYPKELQLKADSVKISYNPFSILAGKFNAEFVNPRITYKNIQLPLEISHRERIAAVIFRKKFLNLKDLEGVLSEDIYLEN